MRGTLFILVCLVASGAYGNTGHYQKAKENFKNEQEFRAIQKRLDEFNNKYWWDFLQNLFVPR